MVFLALAFFNTHSLLTALRFDDNEDKEMFVKKKNKGSICPECQMQCKNCLQLFITLPER